MSNYNSLSGFKVDGSVESSVQGKLLGSFTTMPTADASNLGATVLYQGATTASYTQGSLYKCIMEVVEGINTYRWDKVNVTSIPVESTIIQSGNPISSQAIYDADFASNSDLVSGLAGKIDKGTDAADIAAREAALESGITTSKVQQYDGYATSKFNVADFHTIGGNYGSNNPVTTEEFVNSSVATNTANFRGSFSITGTGADGLGLPADATSAQVAAALDTKIGSAATNNDYAFAYLDTGSSGGVAKYDRYKYSGTYGSGGAWGFEYTLNNSSFTSQQWDAINSTITAAKVGVYDAYATGKQDTLVVGTNLDSTPTENSTYPVTSGGVFSAINTLSSQCAKLSADNTFTGINTVPKPANTTASTSNQIASVAYVNDATAGVNNLLHKSGTEYISGTKWGAWINTAGINTDNDHLWCKVFTTLSTKPSGWGLKFVLMLSSDYVFIQVNSDGGTLIHTECDTNRDYRNLIKMGLKTVDGTTVYDLWIQKPFAGSHVTAHDIRGYNWSNIHNSWEIAQFLYGNVSDTAPALKTAGGEYDTIKTPTYMRTYYNGVLIQ